MDKSYGAVVFRGRLDECQFLLVQHEKDLHWDFPKGHPEQKEHPHETALREVLEETNYHILIQRGFEETIGYILPWGEEKEVTLFLAEAIGEGEGHIDKSEIKLVRWFTYGEALEIITYDNSRDVLKAVRDFLKQSR